ncbi:MAG: hypothetical protein AAFY42_06815, partial [Pseudomonadota bacterium]
LFLKRLGKFWPDDSSNKNSLRRILRKQAISDVENRKWGLFVWITMRLLWLITNQDVALPHVRRRFTCG